jgi:hypothetical protein
LRQNGGRLEVDGDELRLREAELVDVDLSGLRLEDLTVLGSTLERCDLSGLKAKHGRMSGVEVPTVYRDCTFTKSDLRAVNPGPARFERCVFESTRIDKWLCFDTEFVDCRFSGRLTDMVFFGAPVSGPMRKRLNRSVNAFSGNDFREAELRLVAFRGGIDLRAQLLPNGEEYVFVPDLPERLVRARERVEAWPDDGKGGARDRALRMLQRLATGGYELQRDYFGRRDDFRSVPADVRERVWALLTEG